MRSARAAGPIASTRPRDDGRAGRRDAAIALGYALLLMAMSILVPPFEGMDEGSHFARVAALASGQILPVHGVRDGRPGVGAMLDSGLVAAMRRYDFPPGAGVLRATVASTRAALAIPATGRSTFQPHSNTAIYPPQIYLPQVAGAALARLLGLTPLAWLYAARMVGALACAALLWLALRIGAETAPPLLLVAMLPMMIFQSAVLTSDSLLLSCGLVMAACIGRILRRAPMNDALRAILAISTMIVAAGKIAYLPLCALPVMAAWHRGDARTRRATIATALVSVLLFAVWSAVIRHDVVAARFDADVDPARQLQWLLGHPLAGARRILASAVRDMPYLATSAVGYSIGHYNVLLPRKVMLPVALLLGLLLAVRVGNRRQWPIALGFLAICVAIVIGVYGLLFIQWTPVGALRVEGVQGRYLLPLATMLLALPAPATRWWEAWLRSPWLLALGLLPLWEAVRVYWLWR